MVFCSCYYISNPIPTTLGPSQKSQQSFHTLFGLPIFTIEPWSTLLYSLLSDFVCFVLWLSSVSKRDMDMSSALFGSRAICSVASSRVFVKTLDLTLFWHAHVKLSCQMSFVTTVAWSPVAHAPCWRAVFRQLEWVTPACAVIQHREARLALFLTQESPRTQENSPSHWTIFTGDIVIAMAVSIGSARIQVLTSKKIRAVIFLIYIHDTFLHQL